MKKTKKAVESSIQRALVYWLRETYKNNIRIHATLNENNKHMGTMGIEIGIPDLLIWWVKDGIEHTFYHELKTSVGKLSKHQKYWRDKFKVSDNTHYAVSYGFSEAKENCKRIIPACLAMERLEIK